MGVFDIVVMAWVLGLRFVEGAFVRLRVGALICSGLLGDVDGKDVLMVEEAVEVMRKSDFDFIVDCRDPSVECWNWMSSPFQGSFSRTTDRNSEHTNDTNPTTALSR